MLAGTYDLMRLVNGFKVKAEMLTRTHDVYSCSLVNPCNSRTYKYSSFYWLTQCLLSVNNNLIIFMQNLHFRLEENPLSTYFTLWITWSVMEFMASQV